MDAKFARDEPGGKLRRVRRSATVVPRRRRGRWAVAGLAVVLVMVAVDLPLAYAGSGGVARSARNVGVLLSRYQKEGVPVSAIDSLRRQLAQVEDQPWYGPAGLLQQRSSTVAAVSMSAAKALRRAISQDRHQAQLYLDEYRTLVAGNIAWLTPQQDARASRWAAQLDHASTPFRFRSLALTWKSALEASENAAKSAKSSAAASVSLAVGSGSLLNRAAAAEQLAGADQLSELQVPQDVAALQTAQSQGQPGTSQSAALAAQLQSLLAEIGLKQQLANLQESVVGLVDQASFEQVPNAAGFQNQFAAAKAALGAASSVKALGAAQTTLRSLQSSVQAVLCGQQLRPHGHCGQGDLCLHLPRGDDLLRQRLRGQRHAGDHRQAWRDHSDWHLRYLPEEESVGVHLRVCAGLT